MANDIYYLDNAATTPVHDAAFNTASKFLRAEFYNPSAVYDKSIEVKRAVNAARNTLLELLGGSGKIVFTGSATEANNMAIFSNKNFASKRFLFGAGEHPSVMECAKELKNRGANVEFLPLDASGRVNMDAFKERLGNDVAFISVQHVSNETGAINDIETMVKLARRACKDVIFHSDGVQAFMKLDYSVDELGADLYTISAHKIGGPKGIGALYIRKGLRVNPLIFGGGQEDGLRSGTENVFNIVCFAEAAKIMNNDFAANAKKVSQMRQELLEALKAEGLSPIVHGKGVAGIMSLCLSKNVRGETLLHALEKRGVYVSTGSACSATKGLNSTLEAMGVPRDEILSSIRISFNAYTNFDAKVLAKIIKEELIKIEGRNYG